MIKELLLAIIIGGLLGFGVTGGYLTLRQKNQTQDPVIISQPTTIPSPTTTNTLTSDIDKTTNDKLTIVSPENNLLVFNENLNITGNTTSDSQIIINTTTDNFTGKSDQKGYFDVPIKLQGGLNIIKISAIDIDGNQLDTELNITYSTAKI